MKISKKTKSIFYKSILTTLLFATISGCKKESSTNKKSSDTTTTTSTKLLAKWNSIEPNGGNAITTDITYVYDSNKKLITISGVGGDQGIFTGKANFTYTTDSIVLKSNLNYQEELDKRFIIDNLGRITKMTDSKGNSQTFTYSSDGYVVSSKYFIGTQLDESYVYNYSNGNMTSMIQTIGDPQNPYYSDTTNYTYLTDKPAINKVDFAINAILNDKVDYFPIEYSSDLLGKQSKNLLSASVGNFTLAWVFANNVPIQFTLDNNDAIVNLSYNN